MPTLQPLPATPATGSPARSFSSRLSPKMLEEAATRLAGLTVLVAAVVVLAITIAASLMVRSQIDRLDLAAALKTGE